MQRLLESDLKSNIIVSSVEINNRNVTWHVVGQSSFSFVPSTLLPSCNARCLITSISFHIYVEHSLKHFFSYCLIWMFTVTSLRALFIISASTAVSELETQRSRSRPPGSRRSSEQVKARCRQLKSHREIHEAQVVSNFHPPVVRWAPWSWQNEIKNAFSSLFTSRSYKYKVGVQVPVGETGKNGPGAGSTYIFVVNNTYQRKSYLCNPQERSLHAHTGPSLSRFSPEIARGTQ